MYTLHPPIPIDIFTIQQTPLGTVKLSVLPVPEFLAAPCPSPLFANAVHIAHAFLPPVALTSASRMASLDWGKVGLHGWLVKTVTVSKKSQISIVEIAMMGLTAPSRPGPTSWSKSGRRSGFHLPGLAGWHPCCRGRR